MSDQGLIGQLVGKFRVERLLGEGGMGQVYLAVHPALGKRAAVKVLNAEYAQRPDVVQRFFNEARAAAALEHANIVEVYDFDQLADGRPYMLLEFLDGEPLSRMLSREGRLPPETAVSIMISVCAAVGAAHRHGIVHRDLKPDNVFLSNREGTYGVVKVLDFGIAKLLDDSQAGGVQTRGGMVLGTPEYMSPEQALGMIDKIGPTSDVYSAGVIMHQILSGQAVFPGENLTFGQIMIKHAQEAPVPLRALRPELSPEIERVVLKALAKDPIDRWQSMEAFGQALALAIDPSRAAEVNALLTGTAVYPVASATGALPAESGSEKKPTTFSSAAGESLVMDTPRSRWPLAVGVGAVATVAAVAVVFVLVGHGRKEEPAAPSVAPLAHATAPAPVPAKPAVEPAPKVAVAANVAPASAPVVLAPAAVPAAPAAARGHAEAALTKNTPAEAHRARSAHEGKPGAQKSNNGPKPASVDLDAPLFGP